MKISIIMPTYNKENYIKKSIDNILNQTYKNLELIIIDDGSTDQTEKIINEIKDERIIYIKQENQDQLNAIKNGASYITGEIVALFHSDDLLFSYDVLEKNIEILSANLDIDGLYGDYVVIDEYDKEMGNILKTPSKISYQSIVNLLLNFGFNSFGDPFFVRREIFFKYVMFNYVEWNMPYWIKNNESLNLKKIDYYYYKYRVFSGNYATNDIGKFCLLNGIFRTILHIGKSYSIPFFNVQRIIYKIYKMIFKNEIEVFYRRKSQKNIIGILEKAFKKIYGRKVKKDDFYFYNLLNFYKKKNERVIFIEKKELENIFIYSGKDVRNFFKNQKELDSVYFRILEEANKGFKYVKIEDNESKNKIEKILNFLNLDACII